jgi:cellobiose transport system substrate-binding protein
MCVARQCMKRLRILAGGLIAAALMAGCTVGAGQPVFKRVGPLVTLRVGVYGSPGYRESGLYAEYERLHPNVTIVQDDTPQQATYWTALRAGLKSGHAADDIQAIPAADISAVTGPLSSEFVPLNTIGGVAGGSSAFADDWLPWVAQQAMSKAGTTYALGAETGPLAICYRTDLLAEAGLPTRPAVLARDWSTWAGYLSLGRLFKAHIPQGPAFTDSVTSLYGAMVSQSAGQYYSQSGGLAVSTNPAIKKAWGTAVRAARDGLSARLTPGSAAWDRGVTREQFATALCPAWMLPQIAGLSAAVGPGTWGVTAAPGGAGSSGGFYLAIPQASGHQQAAFQLADFLAGEQAGIDLFRTQGEFPANFAAVTAVSGVTSAYFSGAPVGKIFSRAAERTPTTITGPASAAIGAAVTGDLSQVEAGRLTAGRAWRAALGQARAAQAAGR